VPARCDSRIIRAVAFPARDEQPLQQSVPDLGILLGCRHERGQSRPGGAATA
jgi:hypothetical protein